MFKKHNLYRNICFALFALLASTSLIIAFYLFINSASIPEYIYDNVLLVIQDKSPDTSRYNDVLQISIFLVLGYSIPQLFAGLINLAHMKSSPIIGFAAGTIGLVCSNFIIKYFSQEVISYVILSLCVIEMIASVLQLLSFYNTRKHVSEDSFINIGTNRDSLLIYYSFDNTFKEYSLKVADSLGAVVLELETKDKTMILQVIRNAFINKDILSSDVKIDFSKYRNVHLIVPVVVNHIIGPVSDFLKKNEVINSKRVYVEFVSYGLMFKNTLIKQFGSIIESEPKEYIFTTVFAGKSIRRKRISGV